MIVEVFVEEYVFDSFTESESFHVERKFPWQPWIMQTELGTYQIGDTWDGWEIKPGKNYEIKDSWLTRKISTRILSR